MRTGKSVIERQIQLLHHKEFNCNSRTTASNTQDDNTLNINAEEPKRFRPKRSAATVAEQRIRDIADNENH